MIKLLREYQENIMDSTVNMAEIEVFNVIRFSFNVDTTAEQVIAEQRENLLNQARVNFSKLEPDIWKAYTGKTFISYDSVGNITRVDLNEYVGDGNSYIQKNMAFIPAKDVLLYPKNHIVMLDTVTNQPDLYERQV